MTKIIKNAALQLAETANRQDSNYVANDIESLVNKHALISVGSAFIPIPGADLVAMTANVWTMYVRINRKVDIKFSDNMMKSIGSAILGNLTSNLIVLSCASMLKFIPMTSLLTGAATAAVTYATTVTAAWVYIRALTKFVSYGYNSDSSLKTCVDDILNDKDSLKSVFNDAKSSYKK